VQDEQEIVADIVRSFLGKEKLHYESKGQYSFNCPYCDQAQNKGNLEVNVFKHVYKCWACGDSNGTHGVLGKLIDEFGTKKQKKIYSLFKPEEDKKPEPKKTKFRLPEGYTEFKNSNPIYPVYKQAMNYLKERNITQDIIEKYKVGFCDKGDFIGRIIIPSFDQDGNPNYFIARSWDKKTRSKYKNPQAEKDKIIFNESLIDWNEDIYICEGVFDAVFLPNSIPMLGKTMSKLLFETLYEKAKGDIIICLDADAWVNAVKLYHILNGGLLYGKIKIIKLTGDNDVADLKGDIDSYYYNMK
jgi:DNA primase